jgi:hypothetical protein
MIPKTLPGKEKISKSQLHPPPPPPPPPPPKEESKQQKVPKPLEKPPRPAVIAGTTQKSILDERQIQFNDTVDENKPAEEHGPRKDAKGGRKLLGIFNRNKKKKSTSNNRRPQAESDDADGPEVDVGSIISDAVLKDRHDRYVTKL